MKDYVDELTKARKEKVEKDQQFEKDVNEFLHLTKNIDPEIFATNFVKFRINKTLLIEKGYVDIKLYDFKITSSDGVANEVVEVLDRLFNLIRYQDDLVRNINSNAERVVKVEMSTTGNCIKYLDSYIKTTLFPSIKPFLEEWGFEVKVVDHEVLVANGYVELALNHFVINKNNKQENNLDDADFNTYTVLFEMLDSDVVDTIDRQPRERAVFRVSEVVFLEDYIKNTLIAGVAPHLHKMGLKTKIVGDKTSKVTDGYYRISLGEKR